jgi:hypothetical protein
MDDKMRRACYPLYNFFRNFTFSIFTFYALLSNPKYRIISNPPGD